MRSRSTFQRLLIAAVSLAWITSMAAAQVPTAGDVVYSPGLANAEGQSSAYPKGDFYEQLSVASGSLNGPSYRPKVCGPEGCETCANGGYCEEHWGCGGSPFRTGPGCDDRWRVGPRWRIQVDGVMLYREETNLDALAVGMGTTLAAADYFENFDHGAGVRILGTAYWPQCKNYELALGYVGVDSWNANIVLPVVNLPPVVGPPASVALDERRTLNYRSSVHALELNWQALNDISWKPYAGIRYIALDETIRDDTRQYPTTPLAVTESSITTDLTDLFEVRNNLIGFQLGIRRDLWQVSRRIFVQGFANSGLYCNLISRSESTATTVTNTTVLDDDPLTPDIDETGQVQTITSTTGNRVKTNRTQMSYAGEASVSLVWKINHCFALRSGYQVLVLTGVELADDAYLGIDDTHEMFYHGGFAGFEYRR